MDIVMIETDKVKPYKNNTKKHPQKQIDTIIHSIEQYGFNQPIVVDKDNVIIVGHGRWIAATQMGYSHIPILIRADLTEEKAKKYRIADNKTNESDWEMVRTRDLGRAARPVFKRITKKMMYVQ